MSTKPNFEQFLQKGLSSKLAQKKLEKNGKNEIKTQKTPSNFYFFISQFKNPLVLVLVIAAAVTAFLHEISDTIVISMAVLLNAILGFFEEKKAYKSMDSLKKVLAYKAWVLRDGEKKEVDTRDIVIGDLVWLYEGDVIPADAVIVKTKNILVNEAILTGESDAVVKSEYKPKFNQKDKNINSHIKNNLAQIAKEKQVFAGSNVVSGQALALITKTAMDTKMGEIAQNIDQVQAQKTPLEKRLDSLARFITIGVIFISVGIFIYGISIGREFEEMFTTSVALAVAAIPEGLIIALTAILSIGMQRILKKNALVRNLMAAETLGTVNCVCVDKTGTLTEGKLKVIETKFTNDQLAYKASIITNDMRDAVEISRWEWAKKLSQKNKKYQTPNQILQSFPRQETIPFSSETRFLATMSGNEIFLCGSPEELLEKSSLSKSLIKKEYQTIDGWAAKGRRMIGLAYIKSRSEKETKKAFTKLKKGKLSGQKITWLGLIAFIDPVRKDIKKTFAKAGKAGVDFKIITGDYKVTALSVAKQIGLEIKEDQVLEGKELENMTDANLKNIVNQITLFARTNPSQKLRIVNALKANKKVIAMMGDGVNDAPALATSDIGIVVSEASQISQDTADMILLDSNVKTIVDAIEEGRGIFDNLRKIILYLLSDTFTEVILITVSLIFNWPPIVTAAQILWINLVNDGLPNLALTLDPKEKDLLKRKPLSPNEKLINSEIRTLIIFISLTTAINTLLVFKYIWPIFGVETARTMAFTILSLDSILYVFSCKSLTKNLWEEEVFNNKYLNLSFLISLFFTILPVHFKPLQNLLGTTALNLQEWLIVVLASSGVIIIIEIIKFIYKKLNLNK